MSKQEHTEIAMVTRLYLFLDFDGVLHPEGVGPELEFCHLENFENLMRHYPQVLIVLSTSWRLSFPLEDLVALFSIDIRDRIVGATPNLQELAIPRGLRQKECEQWLASNAPGASWLAVDDRVNYFDEVCPQLVLLPHVHVGGTGLEGESLVLLQQRLGWEIASMSVT